jgi:hypothetical protein
MTDYVCLIGLDEPEYTDLKQRLDVPTIAHPILPQMLVREGQLFVESPRGGRMLPVSKVVFHGIFDEDLDFITGLALWGGPCLPNARAMMDCRLKFAAVVRALDYTHFGYSRGFVTPWARFDTESEHVAKWGNWHCGENKERFTNSWSSENAAIIEPYIAGEAVRVVVIGDRYWQVNLKGDDWLKSIHHPTAHFMEVDEALLEDTRRVGAGFGLELLANDYIVGTDGNNYLLEVNHIPNVTRFPEIWEGYADYVTQWVHGS